MLFVNFQDVFGPDWGNATEACGIRPRTKGPANYARFVKELDAHMMALNDKGRGIHHGPHVLVGLLRATSQATSAAPRDAHPTSSSSRRVRYGSRCAYRY